MIQIITGLASMFAGLVVLCCAAAAIIWVLQIAGWALVQVGTIAT